MKVEQGLTTQQIVGNLIKVVHRGLELYVDDSIKVARQDPNLFSHIVSWNNNNGEIRDTKVAFPVCSLRGESGEQRMFHENAIAHLLLLDPRNLVRASYFHRMNETSIPKMQVEAIELVERIKAISSQKKVNQQYLKTAKEELEALELRRKEFQKVVKQFTKLGNGLVSKSKIDDLFKYGINEYLKLREENKSWWNSTVVQHRESMKSLYSMWGLNPSPMAQKILFERKYPKGSVFEAIKELKNMTPKDATSAILKYQIPFTIAIGSVGGVEKNSDLVLSLIEGMSGNELITNSSMLSKLGVMDNPILKSSYENALLKAQKDKKTSTLKAGRAAAIVTDVKIKAKLENLQETKLDNLKGLEGDWLILADRSGSMHEAVSKSKEVAAFLARVCKGKVYLVYFNKTPVMYDVSTKSLEEIRRMTAGIVADGNTSIGCGLQLINERGIIVNGIIICSDGGENADPYFFNVYKQYESKYQISPTIYLIHFPGEPDRLSVNSSGFPYEKLDAKDLDHYGFDNLAKILRTSRYTLLDDIMQSPLLTINEVLTRKEKN